MRATLVASCPHPNPATITRTFSEIILQLKAKYYFFLFCPMKINKSHYDSMKPLTIKKLINTLKYYCRNINEWIRIEIEK
jgi:hypothetical protein